MSSLGFIFGRRIADFRFLEEVPHLFRGAFAALQVFHDGGADGL